MLLCFFLIPIGNFSQYPLVRTQIFLSAFLVRLRVVIAEVTQSGSARVYADDRSGIVIDSFYAFLRFSISRFDANEAFPLRHEVSEPDNFVHPTKRSSLRIEKYPHLKV